MKKELICPATGLRVFTRPEWINKKVRDSFTANFYVISNSIIYSRPEGKADLEGVEKSLELNNEVVEYVSQFNENYLQIEDYADLKSSSQAARRYFTYRMKASRVIRALIFCNLSPPLAMAVKIGRQFIGSSRPVKIARSYAEGIGQALELCRESDLVVEDFVLGQRVCIDNSLLSLSPWEVLSDHAWDIQTSQFSNRALIIDNCILHSTVQGTIGPDHVLLGERLRRKCQAALPGGSSLDYIVVDTSRLKRGNRKARTEYTDSLKKWHDQFPLRTYIVYGANTFVKTATLMARPFLPFRIEIARSADHAFRLVKHDRQTDFGSVQIKSTMTKAADLEKKNIEKVLAYIGSIRWEEEGVEGEVEIGKGDPYYILYQTINLVKEEIDELLNERKLLQDQILQSQKMQALGTLAGGIAHDFNNILTTIIGCGELALDDARQGKAAPEAIEQILKASGRARDLVRQILTFSHKGILETKPLNLNQVISTTAQVLESSIPERISLELHLEQNIDQINGDANQLKQMLLNLASNAMDAMPQGGKLVIKAQNLNSAYHAAASGLARSPEGYVLLTVSDTGEGMSPHTLGHIFDPFYTTKEVGQGTGLGLATVYGIVDGHGGFITCHSEPGAGTSFKIYLPSLAKGEDPGWEGKGDEVRPPDRS